MVIIGSTQPMCQVCREVDVSEVPIDLKSRRRPTVQPHFILLDVAKIPHSFDIDNHPYNQNPGLTLNLIAFFIMLVAREPHMGHSVPDFGSSN